MPTLFRSLLLFAVAALYAWPGVRETRAADRPNILLVMVDDMGYSDLGCYGGEIETPHLDALAADGLRYTQFYNTARCWPTRAALLTGFYPQQVRRDTIPGYHSGGGGRRPAWARLAPAMLKQIGYRSYHSGKWHMDGMPIAAGFDRSYYIQDQGRYWSPTKHWLNDRPLSPVKRGSEYFITTALADYAVDQLREHARDHADKPFFTYLAFTAPHFPLHALPEDIAKYEGVYDVGWDELRRRRYARQLEMGLLPNATLSEREVEIGPPYDFPDAIEQLGTGETNQALPWDELTAEQRRFQAEKMAIHAAMVDRMDHELGRVLDQIRAMDAFENTLILFLSDNGASAEIMVRADGHDPEAPLGSADSYLCLGPGFSTAANTPFRRHKTWVHEGGAATPLIVHWPTGIDARGEMRRTPGHAIDILPTILAITGAARDAVAPPLPGKDISPTFDKDQDLGRELLWFHHEGNRAIRMGDWKLVAAKDAPWELYDLAEDRSETVNLATQYPQRVEEMASRWQVEFGAMIELAIRDGQAQPLREEQQ